MKKLIITMMTLTSLAALAAPCKVAIPNAHLASLIGYGVGEHRMENVINHALAKRNWMFTDNPSEADATVILKKLFNDLIQPSVIGPRAQGSLTVDLNFADQSVELHATKYFTMPASWSGGCGNDFLDPAILKAGKSILRQLKNNLPQCRN